MVLISIANSDLLYYFIAMIFGIGLSKTGTKSLTRALEILGYNAKHLPRKSELFSNLYDAYTDIPTLAYLPQLRAMYPDAKYIYTSREITSWLESCSRHFRETDDAYFLELRRLVYGSFLPQDEDLVISHRLYEDEANKLKNCLILPLEANNKWQLLCEFLGKDMPVDIPYPHVVRDFKRVA